MPLFDFSQGKGLTRRPEGRFSYGADSKPQTRGLAFSDSGDEFTNQQPSAERPVVWDNRSVFLCKDINLVDKSSPNTAFNYQYSTPALAHTMTNPTSTREFALYCKFSTQFQPKKLVNTVSALMRLYVQYTYMKFTTDGTIVDNTLCTCTSNWVHADWDPTTLTFNNQPTAGTSFGDGVSFVSMRGSSSSNDNWNSMKVEHTAVPGETEPMGFSEQSSLRLTTMYGVCLNFTAPAKVILDIGVINRVWASL